MRKDGDHVRITAQLIDVATGSHLWAERYDRDLEDVFAVQDEITQAVVAAIEPQLYAAESFRSQRKTPDNMDAWDLVMRALQHYWRVTRQDNLVAQALLEKAIAVDPGYGQALSLLAACHTFSAHMGWEEMPTWFRWRSAPRWRRSAPTVRMRGRIMRSPRVYLFDRRFEDSIAEFELALQLNPNFSPARGLYGLALSYRGRWEEGDRAAREALRLRPRDPFAAIYCGVAAYCQYVGRNYDEAIRLSREALRQRSDFVGAHRVLTAAAAMAGERDVAKAALQDLRVAQPEISLGWIERTDAVRTGCGPQALSARVSACWPEIAGWLVEPGSVARSVLRSFAAISSRSWNPAVETALDTSRKNQGVLKAKSVPRQSL